MSSIFRKSISKRRVHYNVSIITFLVIRQRRVYTYARSPHQFSKTRDPKISHSLCPPSPSHSFSTSSNSYSNVGFIGRSIHTQLPQKLSQLRLSTYAAADLTAQHLWFNYMSKVLANVMCRQPWKKIFMGQAVYGPANAIVFFSCNAALQGESGDEIVARLKRDLLPTLKNGHFYWPIFDFATRKFVPVYLQAHLGLFSSYFIKKFMSQISCVDFVIG